MTLTRSWSNESIKLELVNKTVPELLQLNEFNVFHFNYVLFPGNYSITFRHCDIIDIDNLAFGCEPIQDAITSGELYFYFWIWGHPHITSPPFWQFLTPPLPPVIMCHHF